MKNPRPPTKPESDTKMSENYATMHEIIVAARNNSSPASAHFARRS
jgi:hypothetical protein